MRPREWENLARSCSNASAGLCLELAALTPMLLVKKAYGARDRGNVVVMEAPRPDEEAAGLGHKEQRTMSTNPSLYIHERYSP